MNGMKWLPKESDNGDRQRRPWFESYNFIPLYSSLPRDIKLSMSDLNLMYVSG